MTEKDYSEAVEAVRAMLKAKNFRDGLTDPEDVVSEVFLEHGFTDDFLERCQQAIGTHQNIGYTFMENRIKAKQTKGLAIKANRLSKSLSNSHLRKEINAWSQYLLSIGLSSNEKIIRIRFGVTKQWIYENVEDYTIPRVIAYIEGLKRRGGIVSQKKIAKKFKRPVKWVRENVPIDCRRAGKTPLTEKPRYRKAIKDINAFCALAEQEGREYTIHELAREFKVDKMFIYRNTNAKRRGVKGRRKGTVKHPGLVTRAQELHADGLSVSKIASKLKVAKATVYRYLEKDVFQLIG